MGSEAWTEFVGRSAGLTPFGCAIITQSVAGVPALIRQQLLERESELAEITLALEAASSGQGRLVVIEAAAGLGKTRLLEAALAEARKRGMTALAARGMELEREFAFGVVRQLLEPQLASVGGEQREQLFAGAAAFARPLFGEAEDAVGPPADPSYATLHGLYWLLATLTGEHPVLLALDDAQWADSASLRFLSFLLPRLAELQLVVLVALRRAEPGAERAELARLGAAAEALSLSPSPLSGAAVAALAEEALGEVPAPEFAAACHKASAGNPFYLNALLRELRGQGLGPSAEQAEAVGRLGPRAVSRAVLLRLSALDADAPALARALAVLGDGASLCEAAELAGVEESRAGAVCDLLVRAAVLRRSERLEFVHPIVRESVYAELAPHERAAEHARAGRALAAAGAEPERVAAQLLETTPAGDSWVVEQLRGAAQQAIAKGAPEVAVRYLRRALAEPPEAELQARVLLELGAAGAAAGEEDALERLEEAFDCATECDVIAAAAFELGRALLYFARAIEAIPVLERALDRLRDGDIETRRRLEALLLMQAQSEVSARRLVVGRLREAGDRAERAQDAPPEVLATIALQKAENTGPAEQATELAVAALRDGRLVEELAAESPALYFATCALTLGDHGDIAEQHLDRAIAVARRHGSARGFAFASCFRGWTRYRRGDLPGAEADLDRFLELASEFSLEILYPFGVGTLIGVQVDRGQREAAASTLRSADAARWDPDSVLFQELRAGRARLRLLDGRPREALAEALAIAGWEKAWGASHDAWTHWRPLASLAHFALGEREQADRIASETIELARAYGADDYLGLALRTAGVVARDGGIDLLEEAVSVLERSQARLEHARALVELGAALRRANRRSEAREPLASGLELARRCGARALVERAGEELEATGARPRRFLRGGVEALTPSERRIAQRAAEGRSNREIAQALFVTQKTVEMHLSNAYRKLDVSSRSELPARLASEQETSGRGPDGPIEAARPATT